MVFTNEDFVVVGEPPLESHYKMNDPEKPEAINHFRVGLNIVHAVDQSVFARDEER